MTSAFYDAGKLRQIANNLFLGWGYNYYKRENQLRADDQLVRSHAATLLGQAASSIQTAEVEYRHAALPPTTRASPYPDQALVSKAQSLEFLNRKVVALEGRLHALPAPAQDLMSLRFRQEEDTLVRLIEVDELLVGQSELLRSRVEGQTGAWILENISELQDGLSAIEATLRDRVGILSGLKP